eukprot:5178511-Ditylum_brightwellii.AAC.1
MAPESSNLWSRTSEGDQFILYLHMTGHHVFLALMQCCNWEYKCMSELPSLYDNMVSYSKLYEL